MFMENVMNTLNLVGCATGSSIVTGDVRPAIDPNEVKLYLEPPLEYETIGLVEASSEVELSTQAAQDRAIGELKAQAARLGANGVLLGNTGDVYYGDYANEIKTAKGKAIFVIQE
jgi:hypothetical protein